MINRPFFRPQNKSAPDSALTPPDLDDLRVRILQALLLGTCALGLVAIVPSVAQRVSQDEMPMAILLSGAFISLLLVTFFKPIPYRARALAYLALVSILGVSTLLADGLYGNARVYLLILPILASLLLGGRAGFLGILASLGLLIVMGVLMLTGRVPLPDFGPEDGHANPSFWIVSISTFAMVGVTITISLYAMLNGLSASLSQAKRLAMTLDNERSQLEHRIVQRTQDLERRLVQIRTAAEISRTITVASSRDIQRARSTSAGGAVKEGVSDPTLLLQRVVDLVRERFDLYYVGVFLLDERAHQALLRAGTGEAGQQMLAAKHRLAIDDHSMIGWSIRHRQARIALDVAISSSPTDIFERGKQASITVTRFNNPLLPKTRSEVALPMLSGDLALGAMSVQSERPKAFDQDDLTVLQSIADTLAAALENLRLFQQAQQNLTEIQVLNRQFFVEAWHSASRLPSFSAVEYQETEQLPVGEEAASDSGEPIVETHFASISIPLSLREQQIGSLALEREKPLTQEERMLVEAVTTEAALALENVRLLEQSQRRAGQERLLSDIARQVRGTTDIDTILSITVRELGQALSASAGLIQLDAPGSVGEVSTPPPPEPDTPENRETVEGQQA